ncbi:hypothetical protein GQ55_9G637600 [Panicum hallii var. hallii]|uniref:Uncharacterized protein n=1 Tax=Panicum hallii var. hallii TaxID=1504633 RepID=A0A2T7CIG0_9POAL|nr:hypothetical protein GQ55_9G637600 [Panicum hallii var. hallii]
MDAACSRSLASTRELESDRGERASHGIAMERSVQRDSPSASDPLARRRGRARRSGGQQCPPGRAAYVVRVSCTRYTRTLPPAGEGRGLTGGAARWFIPF